MNGLPSVLSRFLELFNEEFADTRAEAEAILARRAIYDVQIAPGRIFARVEGATGAFISVECTFPVLPEKKIAGIAERIANSALLFAHVLEGLWSPGIEELFGDTGAWILPPTRKEVTFLSAGKPKKTLDASLAALLLAATERFSNDALQVFLLAGHGREEIIARVRHLRKLLCEATLDLRQFENLDLGPVTLFDAEKFYTLPDIALALQFQLRADELPAAILRRVDAPPLWGVEASFEHDLQEVYNRIASRAQAYAIQLAKERVSPLP